MEMLSLIVLVVNTIIGIACILWLIEDYKHLNSEEKIQLAVLAILAWGSVAMNYSALTMEVLTI